MSKKSERVDLSYEVRHTDGRIETWRIKASGARGLRAVTPVLRRLGGPGSNRRRGSYELGSPDSGALPELKDWSQ